MKKSRRFKTSLLLMSLFVLCSCGMVVSLSGNAQGYTGIGDVPQGIVVIPVGEGSNIARSMALQSDGKVLLVGAHLKENGLFESVLIRHNPDGSRDMGFGSNGLLLEDTGAESEAINAIAIQDDKKILVGGAAAVTPSDKADFSLTRLKENGEKDETFGTAGTVITPIGPAFDVITAIAIQPDGKIVVVGNAVNPSRHIGIGMVRYNANGTLDSGFGDLGIKSVFLKTSDVFAHDVLIEGDGKITIAGGLKLANDDKSSFGIFRLSADGNQSDTGFGSNGYIVVDGMPGNAKITGMARQADGKIVYSGTIDWMRSNKGFVTGRIFPTGIADLGFGSPFAVGTGIKTTNGFTFYESHEGKAVDIAVQADKKIVVAGKSLNSNGDFDFSLVRYLEDGTVDRAFGTEGMVQTSIGEGNDIPVSVAIASDGRIVLGGVTADITNENKFAFALAAYNPDGSLDGRFK